MEAAPINKLAAKDDESTNSTISQAANTTPTSKASLGGFLSPKSALKTPKSGPPGRTPETERSVHFDQQVHISVFDQAQEYETSERPSDQDSKPHNQENRKPKRAVTEATTPARVALSKPLAPSQKHNAYARGTASPRTKAQKKVTLAIDMCLAASSQHDGCLAALGKIEASNRRPLLLLRDNESGGAPAFRGLYIQTGGDQDENGDERSGQISRVFGNGPETFSLKDATRYVPSSSVLLNNQSSDPSTFSIQFLQLE